MIKSKTRLLKNTFLISLALSSMAMADMQKGMDAYANGDYESALKEFTIDAGAGNAEAQFNIAGMYLDGKGTLQSAEDALKWYQLSAKGGHIASTGTLGYIYLSGNHVPKDAARGQKLLLEAAEAGHTQSQYILAQSYLYKDLGGELNYIDGVKWYQKAADNGHQSAQFFLAAMYDTGKHVQENKIKAFELYKLAAAQDDRRALYYKATYQIFGEGGVEVNTNEGMTALHKSAHFGHAPAFSMLAYLYGVEGKSLYDRSKAYFWLNVAFLAGQKGTEDGFKNLEGKLTQEERAEAENEIARMYRFGWYGFQEDRTRATDWYFKAATNGHLEAQISMGVNTGMGVGVPQSNTGAVEWYKRAAEKDFPQGQYMYGVALNDGFGVEKNIEEAIKWITKAAESDYPEAVYYLGKEYLNGTKIPQDTQKALHYLNKAVELGDKDAIIGLAKIYFFGQGVEVDIEKGMSYYTTAAIKGDPDAQYILGNLYFGEDERVAKDIPRSLFWLEQAASRNHPDALSSLGRIHMSGEYLPEDIDKALNYIYQAAIRKHTNSQRALALIFTEGYNDDYPAQKPYALIWHYILAETGNIASMGAVTSLEAELSEEVINRAKVEAEQMKEVIEAAYDQYNLVSSQLHKRESFQDLQIPEEFADATAADDT